ncbi:hypothetical protein RIF29_14634 [Crotalaria pallida]|uniref:Uncharacterized protein n=1 Tax=Crotalaria pallida TaxID=3830 RepID=A0AAN9IAH0_CROPI
MYLWPMRKRKELLIMLYSTNLLTVTSVASASIFWVLSFFLLFFLLGVLFSWDSIKAGVIQHRFVITKALLCNASATEFASQQMWLKTTLQLRMFANRRSTRTRVGANTNLLYEVDGNKRVSLKHNVRKTPQAITKQAPRRAPHNSAWAKQRLELTLDEKKTTNKKARGNLWYRA